MSSAPAKRKVQSKKPAAKTKKAAVKAKAPAKSKMMAKAKTTVTKKKAAPAKKPVKKVAVKKAVAKKAAAKKPAKKLTMAEIFAAVHNQVLERQQNIRHLEHLSNNFNQRFRGGRSGGQMQSPRTVHHSRGK